MSVTMISEYKFPDRSIVFWKTPGIYRVAEKFSEDKMELLLKTTNKKEATALFQGIQYGASLTYQLFRKENLEKAANLKKY
jgi:hypothetical protein